ncbi:MAG: dihydropteroate synthase [Bacillota bacterium]
MERRKIIETNRGELDYSRKTLIMGILNLTPDSFSDGGKYTEIDRAVEHAVGMERQGADIIDIGAESTRPGSDRVSLEEEKQRLIPVLKEVLAATSVPISIDTYKSKTAEAALEMGASIINDISGMKFDKKMPETAAHYQAPVVLMHIQGTPETMQENPEYKNLIFEIKNYLWNSIETALKAGIKEDKIIIDPGIGFGKEQQHNLQILNRLKSFEELGYPILIGTSRKSLIKYVTGDEKFNRIFGTSASAAVSVLNGASIVRVHDVEEIRRAVRMADAVKWEGNNEQ